MSQGDIVFFLIVEINFLNISYAVTAVIFKTSMKIVKMVLITAQSR